MLHVREAEKGALAGGIPEADSPTEPHRGSAAVSAAMNAFNRELLANHIRTCVTEDIRGGQDEAVDELLDTMKKLMK